MPRPLITTNLQALRWCRTRRATVKFDRWKDLIYPPDVADTLPAGISCRVMLDNNSCRFGKTLVKAVNSWIQYFNKREEK